MPIKIEMPRLSDTMQQGTVVKWNVKEGQKVRSGDVIADIETDKATMELQAFDDGVVASLAISEGQSVPIGTTIMVLAAAGEDPAAVKAAAGSAAPARSAPAAAAQAQASAVGAASPAPAQAKAASMVEPANGAGQRIFASPLARKVASESGVDLSRVEGTGPSGRITRRDVEQAATRSDAPPSPAAIPTFPARGAPAPAALVAREVPLSTMRRVIADRLSLSKSTIPHYQVTVDVDMDALLSLRAQLNDQLAEQGVKLSVNDFLVRACALAMLRHPGVNARWAGTPEAPSIQYLAEVNIGVAIAIPLRPDGTGGGLVVATLRGADAMGLRQISTQSRHLADKARAKGLSPQEMADATFTISNLGMFGVAHFNAIINPPNVAILAVGAALERPVVRGGSVVPGRVMSMTMSSDHRVVDGAMAAAYLASVRELLEKPATLLV